MPIMVLDKDELLETLEGMSPVKMIMDALECRIGYALQMEDDPLVAAAFVMLLMKVREEAKKEGLLDPSEPDKHQVRGAQA